MLSLEVCVAGEGFFFDSAGEAKPQNGKVIKLLSNIRRHNWSGFFRSKVVKVKLMPYFCATITVAHRGCNHKSTGSVAQLVEQYTFNVRVLGSNPSGATKTLSEYF